MQEGIDLCKKNILDFLEDARLLIERGRLNHAFVSVEFAIEELGKIVMLKEALTSSDAEPVLVEEDVFRKHRGKSKKAWTVLDSKFRAIYDEGHFNDEYFDFRDFFTDTKASHETRLQCAFVDFDESGSKWHIGRDIKETLLVNLIKHMEEKLRQI